MSITKYFQSLGLTPEDDKWKQPQFPIVHPEDVLEQELTGPVNRLLDAAVD